jgi:hypothetical protein
LGEVSVGSAKKGGLLGAGTPGSGGIYGVLWAPKETGHQCRDCRGAHCFWQQRTMHCPAQNRCHQ